jgi:hypothetical protein
MFSELINEENLDGPLIQNLRGVELGYNVFQGRTLEILTRSWMLQSIEIQLRS